MVKTFESDRPRVGIAGKRKRRSRHSETSIYYTATDGRTILENDNQTATLNDVSKPETPSTTGVVSTSAVTPSTRKRPKRNAKKAMQGYDYLAILDEPQLHTGKTDTSVQVSVDGEDHKSNEISDSNTSLLVIENDVNHDQEQIEMLTKQLHEKDGLIAELLLSKTKSYSPATMMRTKNINSKIIESMKLQLEELKQTHDNEIKQLKLEITKWKDKSASLSLELERMIKYNSMQHRNVYNGRFLLEETLESESIEVRQQNEQSFAQSCDNSAVVIHDTPPSTKILSPLRNQKHKVCCASNVDIASVDFISNDSMDHRMKQQAIVAPITLKHVTYLGLPLSFQHKAKFQLMVMSPEDESEDDNI
jgi:hypothetical protein